MLSYKVGTYKKTCSRYSCLQVKIQTKKTIRNKSDCQQQIIKQWGNLDYFSNSIEFEDS